MSETLRRLTCGPSRASGFCEASARSISGSQRSIPAASNMSAPQRAVRRAPRMALQQLSQVGRLQRNTSARSGASSASAVVHASYHMGRRAEGARSGVHQKYIRSGVGLSVGVPAASATDRMVCTSSADCRRTCRPDLTASASRSVRLLHRAPFQQINDSDDDKSRQIYTDDR